MNKKVAVILIIAVILLGGVIFILLKAPQVKNQTETADWQTYQNDTYEVQYPAGAHLESVAPEYDKDAVSINFQHGFITICNEERGACGNTPAYGENPHPNASPVSREVLIDGQKYSIHGVLLSEDNVDDFTVLALPNHMRMHVNFTGNTKDENEIIQTLSTFKFKNSQLQKTDTTGWKTYKNYDYGFEFKYPVDWEADGAYVNMVNQPSSFKISISPQKDSKDYAEFILGGEYALDDTLEISKINNSSELQKIFKESYSWNGKGFSMEPIMIGGFNGFKTKALCSDGPACEIITYSFVKDNNAYQFQCTSDHQLKFEAILSTFKFTK